MLIGSFATERLVKGVSGTRCRWLYRVMSCTQSARWQDCLQFDEDSPQPTVWSRRRASRGCSPHPGRAPCIMLHLETEKKRGGEREYTKGSESNTLPLWGHTQQAQMSHQLQFHFIGSFFLKESLRIAGSRFIFQFNLPFHNVGVLKSSGALWDSSCD